MTDPEAGGGRPPEQQPPVDPQAAAEMARKLAEVEKRIRDSVKSRDEQRLAQIGNQVAEATEAAIGQIAALDADEGKVKAELQKVDENVDQKSSLKGNATTSYEYVRALYDEFSANPQELISLTVRDIPVESNKKIFSAIFSDIKKDLITPETAPFINKIITKALGGRISEPIYALSISEFASLESLNRGMYLEVIKVLRKGYPNGKQDAVDKEVVKLNELIEARKQNKAPLTSLDAQIQDPRAARNGRARGNREELSKEEYSELLTLQNKLKSALSGVTSVPDATKHFADMLDLVYMGINTMERDDPAIARAVEAIKNDPAFKAAFTDADWTRMQKLIDKEGLVQQMGQYELQMSGMYDVAERIQSLKYSNVFSKLINHDGTWNRQGMDELRRDIQSIVNELFKGVAADPFSPFQEAFNPQQEGIMFRYLRRTLLQFANAPEFMEMYDQLAAQQGFDTNPQFQRERLRIQNSFQDLFAQLSNRMSLTLYYTKEAHDNAQQESIPDDARSRIMSKMTLPEIYRLHEDPVLRTAAALLPTYHQYRFAANNNQIPKGYYAQGQRGEDQSHVARDYLPDREMFVRDFQYIIRRAQAWDRRRHPGQARAFSETRQLSDWEFETATPVAEWINRVITQESMEVYANTIPYGGQGTGEMYDTMHMFDDLWRLNPSAGWSYQRGGPDVKSTIPVLKGIRLSPEAEYNYDSKTGILTPRKEYNAKDVYDEAMDRVIRAVPEGEAELRDKLQRKTYEHSITYLDYIRGLVGSKNWKKEGGYGIMRSLQGKFARDILSISDAEWQANFSHFGEKPSDLDGNREFTEYWLERQAGYFSKYYVVGDWAGDAAGAHLQELFVQQTGLNPKIDKFAWEEFKGRYDGGGSKYEHVMKINPSRGTDGNIETDLSFATYKEYRQRSEMARLFHEGLRKEPLVFFNTLTQLVPQLAEGTVKVTLSTGEEKDIPAAEFYFGDTYAEHDPRHPERRVLSDNAIEMRRKVRKDVLVMFGEENVPHIQKIMGFYDQAYKQFGGTEGTDQDKKNRAHQALYRTFTSASLIARGEGTDVMADYFVTDDEIAQRGSMTAEEQQDLDMRIKARELYKNFVVPITELGGRSEQEERMVFGGKGGEHTADVGDQRSLFHRFSRSWYGLKNCPYPPPFYIDTRGVITERPLNENAPARRQGDQTDFFNTIKEDLANFESKMKEWALAGDPASGIDGMRSFRAEIHKKLKTDDGKAKDLVKQLTIVWYKFGEQVGSGRVFPFDIIKEFEDSGKGAMSKIKFGKTANSLSPSDMRDDIEWLSDNGYITESQFKEIQDLMQLEDLRIWGTDIIPSVVFALIMYLLASFIQDAAKEASES